jgi:hypothetical protein
MKQFKLSLLLMLAVLLLAGCWDTQLGQPEADGDTPDDGPRLSDTDSSGCKVGNLMPRGGSTDPDDGVTVPLDNPIEAIAHQDRITIKHHDAIYQCDADIIFTLQAKENVLILTEVDRSDMVADCLCPIDLSVDILDLTPGIYTIEVWDEFHETLFGRVTVRLGDCPDQCETAHDCYNLDIPVPACVGDFTCNQGVCEWHCDGDMRCESDMDCPGGYQCVFYYPGEPSGEPVYDEVGTVSSEDQTDPATGTRPDDPTEPDMPYFECMSDADCPEGMWCELMDCGPNSDCAEPYGYPVGMCVGDFPPYPTEGVCEPIGSTECFVDSDCYGIYGELPYAPGCDWACLNNQCVFDCSQEECFTDDDCAAGYHCEFAVYGEPQPGNPDDPTDSGEAVDPSMPEQTCLDDADCPAGMWCALADCPQGYDCEPYGVCMGDYPPYPGMCVPNDNPSECQSDWQCEEMYGSTPYGRWACMNGKCQVFGDECPPMTCENDADCGDGAMCVYEGFCDDAGMCCEYSYCIFDNKPCESNHECGPGEACINGMCQPDDSCVCPEYYAPVCGEDGVTYDNPCFAECRGVKVVSDGACQQECAAYDAAGNCLCGGFAGFACPAGEVCVFNDANCDPEQGGADCMGICVPEETCVCDMMYAPVCGVDGQTYGNACEAKCANVDIQYEGECQGGAPCSADADCPAGMFCNDCPPYPGCPMCDACGPAVCQYGLD